MKSAFLAVMTEGNRSLSCVLALACTAFLVLSFAFVTIVPEQASAYTARTPIYIYGDSQFTAGNGVTGGSGTESDPYTIEGWFISFGTIGTPLEIVNTRAHFVIRNCTLQGDSFSVGPDVIRFQNVMNGTVESVDAYGAGNGVIAREVANLTIRDSSIHGSDYGITLVDSHGISVLDNDIYSNSYAGLALYSSRNVTISGNHVFANNEPTSHGGEGVFSLGSRNISIADNNISDNGGVGIWEDSCSGFEISNNSLANNGLTRDGYPTERNTTCIFIQRSTTTTLRGNHMTNDGVYIYHLDPSEYSTIDVDESNTVNGEPIRFFKDTAGVRLDNVSTGQLILINCSDAKVSNTTIESTNVGIMAKHVRGLEITDCWFGNTKYSGIELWNVSDFSVRDSSFSSTRPLIVANHFSNATLERLNCSAWYGFYFNNGVYLNASGIRFIGTSDWGLSLALYSVNHSRIVGNAISHSGYGLYLEQCDDLVVERNDIVIEPNEMLGSGDGMYLLRCSNILMTLNKITSAGSGITINECSSGDIYLNNFDSNRYYQAIGLSNNGVRWNASYPTGGNFWSDYNGTDAHKGPLQDIPGADGIGDTPYNNSFVVDNYPQMRPLGVVNAEPVACLTIVPPTGWYYDTYELNASGSWDREDPIGALEVRWDFEGDGLWDTGWASEKNLTHQFPTGGVHRVVLEVRDSGGLTNRTTALLDLWSLPPSLVSFSIDAHGPPMGPPLVFVNEPVRFEVVLTDPEHDPIELTWDFGDGANHVFMNLTEYVSNNVSSVIYHNYHLPGNSTVGTMNCTVVITFTDNQVGGGNHVVSYSTPIRVLVDSVSPTADAGENQTVTSPCLVNFDGTGSYDDWEITNYTWTFTYEGTPITLWGPTPSFAFTEPGTYEVTLNVTDHVGHFNTSKVTVEVQAAIPEFSQLAVVILAMACLVVIAMRRLRPS